MVFKSLVLWKKVALALEGLGCGGEGIALMTFVRLLPLASLIKKCSHKPVSD